MYHTVFSPVECLACKPVIHEDHTDYASRIPDDLEFIHIWVHFERSLLKAPHMRKHQGTLEAAWHGLPELVDVVTGLFRAVCQVNDHTEFEHRLHHGSPIRV